MGLAIFMVPPALILRHRILMIAAVILGMIAVILICWRNIIVYTIRPGSEDDYSEEFQLLPGHPATIWPVLVPSPRIGLLVWIALAAIYLFISISGAGASILIMLIVLPGLFMILVVLPWIHVHFFKPPVYHETEDEQGPDVANK